MLKKLIIKNVALIDYSEIDFSKGLNILSGETGSGKSVIIDSLNFVLGAKADKTMISYGQNFSLVQAEFDISDTISLKGILEELGVEYEDTLIISRKFTIEGKSDIKVNGNAFTLAMLKKITTVLVDIHGQSEHFSLLKESNQLILIDKYCGEEILSIKKGISENYIKLKEIKSKLGEFGGDESSRAIKLDILSYQINEIEKADIKDGEEEELNNLKNKLSNQEKIVINLNEAYQILDGENSAKDLISSALHNILKISDYSEEYQKIADRLDAVDCEVEDIIGTLSNEKDNFDLNPNELDNINERLELIKNIHKKYGFSYQDVNNFLTEAKEQYDKLSNYTEIIEKLTIEQSKIENILYKSYRNLSDIRRKFALEFSKNVTKELSELGMQKAEFTVMFNDFPLKENTEYNLNGQDKIEYMFSANSGQPLKPLAKIISGGEISRFMLALKTVTSKIQEINTFVFDEIDAGISGKTAEIVAEKFAKISVNTQVIAISHLPQISAMSDSSYLIYKEEVDGKTKSYIKSLDKNNKVLEVARLVGGDENNEITIKHSNNLILKAEEYKKSLNYNK